MAEFTPNRRFLKLLVREYQQDHGCTQEDVAAEAGIDAKTLRKSIDGTGKIRSKTLQGLARLLQVEVLHLMLFDDAELPELPAEMGILGCYFGAGQNTVRNVEKQRTLEEAEGAVVLLAKTGQSYLSNGGVHRPVVERFLERGSNNKLLGILLNPYSTAAIQMYLNWIRGSDRAHYGVELSRHAEKLGGSILGFKTLKQRFPGVNLRLTSFDLGATVLWTTSRCFVEPYLQFDEKVRVRDKLDTYELLVESDSDFGRAIRSVSDDKPTHLGFYTAHSVELPQFAKHRDQLAGHVSELLETMCKMGEIQPDENKAIREYLRDLKESIQI